MIKLLRKLFIKNYENVNDSTVRAKHGILAACGGIFINILLFCFKFIIGFITSSMSIISDAFNNLSDLFSCFVNLIGFKLAKKPADYEHPYGHARIEYIAGMIVSFIILMIGALLFINSLENLINQKSNLSFNVYAFVILGASILLKLILALFYRSLSKSINSVTLKASMSDSFNDIIATFFVLVAYIIQYFFPSIWWLDSALSMGVAIFIIFNGIKMIRETASPLIGKNIDNKLIKSIVGDIKKHKEIIGVHDVLTHTYGPNVIYITLHAEVDGYKNIFKSHDLIENIEEEIDKKYGAITTIHMDPIDTKSNDLKKIKPVIENVVNKYDKRISFHDLRLIKGSKNTKVIFDLLAPIEDKFINDLANELKDEIKKLDKKYRVIINVDYDLSNGKDESINFGD